VGCKEEQANIDRGRRGVPASDTGSTEPVPSHGSVRQEAAGSNSCFRADLRHHVLQCLRDITQKWDYILEPTLTRDSTSPALPAALGFQLACTSQHSWRHRDILVAGQIFFSPIISNEFRILSPL